jgi:hypothetical protein
MKDTSHPRGERFRVWIARYDHWQPGGYGEVPPAAIAVEPAEQATMSGDEASTYVEAFNRAALGRPAKLWAVAVPVSVRYEGEPQPGQTIEVRDARLGARFAQEKNPPPVSQASTSDGLPPRECA